MNVGIITLQYAHNYGASLQAFALKRMLEEYGHKVTIINYIPDREKYKYSRKLKRSVSIKNCMKSGRPDKLILDFMTRKAAQTEWDTRYNGFSEFMQDYLLDSRDPASYMDEREISNLKMDAFICGSDQVWNPQIIGGYNPVYFLDFKTDALKISYAASAGQTKDLSDNFLTKMKNGLSQFHAVSVRETELADIISKFNGLCNPVVTCDPTVLLPASAYEQMASRELYEQKPYNLAYFLQDDLELENCVDYLQNKNGTDVIEIHWLRNIKRTKNRQKNNLNVQEFLWYIKNAECVITNSFHGTVFSLLFHKPFYSVYQNNIRIDTLLLSTNTASRHIRKITDMKNARAIEWNAVDARLKQMRMDGRDFLKNALG